MSISMLVGKTQRMCKEINSESVDKQMSEKMLIHCLSTGVCGGARLQTCAYIPLRIK